METEAPRNTNEKIDYKNMSKVTGTTDLRDATNKLRESLSEKTDRANKDYKFPDTYNPKMGLKVGNVTELRLFFRVKPGHAEALKQELRKFKESEERNSKAAHLMTGIQDMTCTLFDNDTRYLHTTEFDTEWDPYIDDSVPTDKQRLIYANWLQHLVEAGDFGPDNIPTANDIKVLFNQQRETATVFIRTFSDTVFEQYRMHDLKKAFEEVLNDPNAEEALHHPALKPLLDLAAD
ncbi:MAG TPA: hypothetical protein VE954_04805 [Oligoflexus sp.]|uniref:hypothetical protein n=1 Tax=Oligoflexus sp. TaxID=1971216 RepID=UPI002D6CB857|nr:hypothetical protein [Oligoflexus sp.]HYX32411.1 hypothetical protein [Oligoflexus sp.]